MNIEKVLSQLTLEEKAGLCSGKDGWFTKAVERLGVESIMMTDGPHGLRKMKKQPDGSFSGAVEATCFPSAAGLACSWNRDLITQVGVDLAKEAKAQQVSILLGPGVNMKRSPLCGRNFEYFAEDPYLAGHLGAAYVKGVQSQGVGTSLKHFAVNNQETRRFTTSAQVDMRCLREIYLTAFEIVVKTANPLTIMESYNRINGTHACESKWLLTDILRDEWGYKGLVMSDWHAINDRVKSLEAGCDLEMPYSFGFRDEQIVQAVENGQLDIEVVNTAVRRVLECVNYCLENMQESGGFDVNEHHRLAGEVSRECMVLLKNDNDMLPFSKNGSVAVIGEFARTPRYQGGGSSHVNPTMVDDIFQKVEAICGKGSAKYAKGYDGEQVDKSLIDEAVALAKQCGRAIIFAGMPESYESEGKDRTHMRMPNSHNELIKAVSEQVENTVVVLLAGAPVEMPWLASVHGLLHAYLGGQALGGGITDIIFGDANPCGKLAETHPVKLQDNPSYLNFPGEGDICHYAEGIFIGYRYYQKKLIKPAFEFGFGLSYTSFEYSDLQADEKKVSFTVTNTGKLDGKEIAQLYIGCENSGYIRPVKELKGFEKVFLKAGESKRISFELDFRSFAFYDVFVNDWRVPTGDYNIYVGASSENTPLTACLHIVEKNPPQTKVSRNTPLGDISTDPTLASVRKQLIDAIVTEPMLEDVKKYGYDIKDNPTLMRRKDYPPRHFIIYRRGKLSENALEKLLDDANKQLEK